MKTFSVSTGSKTEFVDITDQIQEIVDEASVDDGVCYAFVPHTTASITINENWDPSVKRDILLTLNDHIVPPDSRHRHDEGNSPAHIKASLMGSSVVVLVESRRLHLGRWQGVFLVEFDGPRRRNVWVKLAARGG